MTDKHKNSSAIGTLNAAFCDFIIESPESELALSLQEEGENIDELATKANMAAMKALEAYRLSNSTERVLESVLTQLGRDAQPHVAAEVQQAASPLEHDHTPRTREEDIAPRNQIFISYNKRDSKWLSRLQIHLKPIERSGTIIRWDDTLINPGSKWEVSIREAISRAKVAVLLISADYLASDFITSNELPTLLAAAETEGAVIIPVILSPCRFAQIGILSQFQSINAPSQPLIKMSLGRQEDTFVKIVEAIERTLTRSADSPTMSKRNSGASLTSSGSPVLGVSEDNPTARITPNITIKRVR